jgi:hypothetical protein
MVLRRRSLGRAVTRADFGWQVPLPARGRAHCGRVTDLPPLNHPTQKALSPGTTARFISAPPEFVVRSGPSDFMARSSSRWSLA